MQVCGTKNLVPDTCGQWGGLGVKGCCNSLDQELHFLKTRMTRCLCAFEYIKYHDTYEHM
jgi:hypothetical protein